MTRKNVRRGWSLAIVAATAAVATGTWGLARHSPESVATASFIVEARTGGVLTARRAIEAVGGHVTTELPIIDAVTAQLTSTQRQQLATNGAIRSVFEDAAVDLASARANVRDTFERARW